ncbi:hypothetical protein HQ865_15820 [Mucilaginibacter mali]|uniref:Secreted protein with PEP-CTERM sorting signal n=1 Tax=Mucilaginibacter mali TaxID=2740462 RepID=A0A7D4UMK3_9SPHI|nr:hypothetical protein [Mucilaginibacter mali]QKJ31161.1 hypothetical protein HQ865_15820 [Mucilaginibacter mali]
MKSFRLLLAVMVLMLAAGSVKTANAQCAMCSTMVETNNKSGAGTTKGLNNGVMYLLAAPYLAVGTVGFVWYRKYRRKNAANPA